MITTTVQGRCILSRMWEELETETGDFVILNLKNLATEKDFCGVNDIYSL